MTSLYNVDEELVLLEVPAQPFSSHFAFLTLSVFSSGVFKKFLKPQAFGMGCFNETWVASSADSLQEAHLHELWHASICRKQICEVRVRGHHCPPLHSASSTFPLGSSTLSLNRILKHPINKQHHQVTCYLLAKPGFTFYFQAKTMNISRTSNILFI